MCSKKDQLKLLFVLLLMGALILSGCDILADIFPSETEGVKVTEEPEGPSKESTDDSIGVDIIGPTPAETEMNPIPPEPTAQSFRTSDGVELQGMFYPARTAYQPLIVMMHWAGGDMRDWQVIAPWLQNSGVQQDFVGSERTWLEVSWFPVMPEDVSFNVFTFTFRGCEGGCQSLDPEGWLLDIEAAMMFIQGFEGVDLSRVATVGASIGADGAVYGCTYYNAVTSVCHGAFSISPGGYLKIPYADAITYLEDDMPPASGWCLFAVGDTQSATACENASGDLYQATEVEGQAHGMALISPESDPNPLIYMLSFFNKIGICDDCP